MKIRFTFLLLLLMINAFAQDNSINVKRKLFFGADIGLDIIETIINNEPNKSFQGGLLLEYYFIKEFSISGRIKYYKTGLSFVEQGDYGKFDGEILSMPIDLKWEFNIYKNLKGNLKSGWSII